MVQNKPRYRLISRGRCSHACEDFEENRWKRMSKFPGLAKLQKKCKTCGYACYEEDFAKNPDADYGKHCPCCGYKFTRRVVAAYPHAARDQRLEEKYANAH